jgi:hypothetical protein
MSAKIARALRKTAEAPFQEGCCLLMRAFDLAEDGLATWEFDKQTRGRAEDLIRELMALFHESTIKPKREHVADLQALQAEGDQAFQRFMAAIRRPGLAGDPRQAAPVKRRCRAAPKGGPRRRT